MTLAEIIARARATDPAAFGKTSDKRAVKILRASLRQVTKELKSTEEGQVVVNGLGRFAVRNVERKRDGSTVKKRRVIFRHGDSKKRRTGRRKTKLDAT